MGFGFKVQAIGGVLNRILLWPVQNQQGRNAVIIGPEHGLMSRISQRIEFGFDIGPFGSLGNGHALRPQQIARAFITRRAFIINPDFPLIHQWIGVMDGAAVPFAGRALLNHRPFQPRPGAIWGIRPGHADINTVIRPPNGRKGLII